MTAPAATPTPPEVERELPPNVLLERALEPRPCACALPAADPRDVEPTCVYCGRPVRLDGGMYEP